MGYSQKLLFLFEPIMVRYFVFAPFVCQLLGPKALQLIKKAGKT